MKKIIITTVFVLHVICHAIINVSPIYIEFSGNKNAIEVTLENFDTKERVFNASIKQWSQDLGEDIYSDTDEVLVLPAMRKVSPNSEQKFRVILRKKTEGSSQKSFRLFFREVPNLRKNMSPKAALSIAFQFVVPVFVNEKNYIPRQDITWAAQYDLNSKKVTLKVENKGNTFLKLGQLKAKGIHKPIDASWRYILPTNQKNWEIKNSNTIDKKISLSFVELVAQRPVEKSQIIEITNIKKQVTKKHGVTN